MAPAVSKIDQSAFFIWVFRLVLVVLLVICSLYSKAFWRARFTIRDCLPTPQLCMGKVVETKPLLEAKEKVGDTWVLSVEKLGVILETRSALRGVVAGDVLEASITFVGPREIALHDYAVLRPWRTELRTIVSIIASVFVFLVLWKRYRRSVAENSCRNS